MPERFNPVGVCLVYVEALPGAKMEGCAFFLDSMPIIGLSARGKRLDKFLFTLMHEVAHLTLGHVTSEAPLIESLDDLDENANEEAANDLAGAWVLPRGLPHLPRRVSKAWVAEQGGRLGINFIVLVGRLQKEGRLPWRTPLVKDAPIVDAELEAWT